jgi:hypothetical protein
LEELQRLITEFQLGMRAAKDREIEELKKRFETEAMQKTKKPREINVDEIEKGSKRKQPIQFNTKSKQPELLASPNRSMKDGSHHSSLFKSKLSEKSQSMEREKLSTEGRKSFTVRPRLNQLDLQLSRVVKNHVPKGPLLSQITNDSELIFSFFERKVQSAQLLYRSSDHDYSVAKFHEKCDEQSDTLTLVLT